MIYVPDTADIDELCQIAQIPEASRASFANEFSDAVNAAIKAGEEYRTPPGFLPLMVANGRAVADAAFNLINALEDCDPNATRLMNGLLPEGTLDEHVQSVRNLLVVANQLAKAFRIKRRQGSTLERYRG